MKFVKPVVKTVILDMEDAIALKDEKSKEKNKLEDICSGVDAQLDSHFLKRNIMQARRIRWSMKSTKIGFTYDKAKKPSVMDDALNDWNDNVVPFTPKESPKLISMAAGLTPKTNTG